MPRKNPGSESKRSGAASAVRDRVVELVRVPASELRANPKNWRRHPQAQRAALRGLLEEVGFADALLARRDDDGQLVLIDGHLRREESAPDAELPVLILDVTEEEADKILLTLDPLASMAEPDPDAVAELLRGITTSSGAVEALLDRIAREANARTPKPEVDADEVPAYPKKAITKPGDLWRLGEHRLLCGDARSPEAMARLVDGNAMDVLWTDPPYGVSYVGKTAEALTLSGDDAAGLVELLTEAFAVADGVLVPGARVYVAHPAGALSLAFGGAFAGTGWRLHQTLCWVKDRMVLGHADYHYRHEPILYGYKAAEGRRGRGSRNWYGGNDQDTVLEIPRPDASREHPTMKPVELVAQCLRNSSRAGHRVLDPFCGSGSTLIACEAVGRIGYGLEIDPAYVDVAVKRWETFTGWKAELAPAGSAAGAGQLSA